MAVQAMLVEGLMARTVADLRIGLSIAAGRHPRDPRSVDAPLTGELPSVRRVALVTDIPGACIPEETLAAIHQAGDILADAGWLVVEQTPPELPRVSEIWGSLISIDFSVLLPNVQPLLTAPLYENLLELCAIFDCSSTPNNVIHAERSRLSRGWSEFFEDHPIVIGPTWTKRPWPADADLEPRQGTQLVLDTNKFITPGSALGIPAVALPMGIDQGMPTGVQIYADLWREDLCLAAAATIEKSVGQITPIDPVD